MDEEALGAKGSEEAQGVVAGMGPELAMGPAPEGGHGGVPVVNLHEQFIDDGGHGGVIHPAEQDGPLAALDVHLHHHDVARLQRKGLLDEPRDVQGVGGRVVAVRHQRVVQRHAPDHPLRDAGHLAHHDRVRTRRHRGVARLVVRRLRKLEQALVDLEDVHLREIARVHAHEPGDARVEPVAAEVQQHAARRAVEVHLAPEQPRQDVRLVFDVRGVFECVAAPEVFRVVQGLDQVALHPAFGWLAYPFHVPPCVLGVRVRGRGDGEVAFDGSALVVFGDVASGEEGLDGRRGQSGWTTSFDVEEDVGEKNRNDVTV